jgi:hypothetical protein
LRILKPFAFDMADILNEMKIQDYGMAFRVHNRVPDEPADSFDNSGCLEKMALQNQEFLSQK